MDDTGKFSARLNALFETSTRPDGKHYIQQDVVDGCQGTITRVYLWKLRTGRARNPSMRVVQALADFFGVSVDYFSAPDHQGGLGAERNVDDPIIAQICEKCSQLDDQGRRVILNLIDYLIKLKS